MSLENFNPYDDLLGLIRSEGKYHNPLTPLVGRITKINDSLTDIEVSACQMPLYKDDLLIDKWLKDKHYNLGYTCDIKNCSEGVVGTFKGLVDTDEYEEVYNIDCINYDKCSKVCKKISDKNFKCEDCNIPCKTELHFDDRLQVDDLVLLVPCEEKFIITSKVVSI